MTKVKKLSKEELIEKIIEDIRENEYDSRELLYDLAINYLETKTKEELLEDYFADVLEEDW